MAFPAIMIILLISLFLTPLSAFSSLKGNQFSPSIPEILKRSDQNYEQIQTLRFHVNRRLERGMQNLEENWEVILQKPNLFRVNYLGSPKRILWANENSFVEYIPKAKKALQFDLNNLSVDEQKFIFSKLIPRIAIPGFRITITEEMLANMDFQLKNNQIIKGRPAFFIHAKNKKPQKKNDTVQASEIKIWIDQDRFSLLQMEVYDGSSFMSSIQVHSFKEWQKNYWIPTRIVTANNLPQGLEKSTYRISQLQVNSNLDPNFFDLKLPKDVDIDFATSSERKNNNPKEN